MDYTEDTRPIDPTTKRARRLVEQSLAEVEGLLAASTTIGDLKITLNVLRELRAAFSTFAPHRAQKKITTFGSARTPPGSPAYAFAEEFARRAADAGFMAITGAGPGIMAACQHGAGRGRSFGVGIQLPFEQSVNEAIHGDPKLAMFKYFFTRKLFFLKETHAVASFPGGFGTLDEAFETLTLVQTGKAQMMPLLFLAPRGDTFWQTWNRHVKDTLLRRGMISDQDLHLYKVTSDLDEAVAELTTFYRVYNSSRWVREQFVIRLNRRLSDNLLSELDRDFADILRDGGFEQRRALGIERDDPDVWQLPRLVFRFDGRNYGRLRQLIDRINLVG